MKISKRQLEVALATPLPLIIVFIILHLSNIILNGMLAYSLKKLKKIKIISFWFIYCLCISDTFVGITGFCCHFALLSFTFEPKYTALWYIYQLSAFMMVLCTGVSGWICVVIGIDRFIRMRYLIRYNVIMTKRKAQVAVALSFLLSSVLLACLAVTRFPSKIPEKIEQIFRLVRNIIQVTFLVIFPISYIMAYRIVKIRLKTSVLRKSNKVCPTKEEHRDEDDKNICCKEVGNALEHDGDNEQNSDLYKNSKDTSSDQGITNDGREINAEIKADAVESQNMDNPENNGDPNELTQQSKRLHATNFTPESEILKYSCCALGALFICYIPFFSLDFYTLVSRAATAKLESTFFIFVCLNSTINGIFLLYFSKGIRAFVKRLFLERN